MIYLDNAATTFPKSDAVYEALDNANRNLAFNSGRGSYKVARECIKLIDDTKKSLIKLVCGQGNENVVFTPSITVALNEILNGIEFANGDNIYLSSYEHNAVARTVHRICKNTGARLIEIPIKEDTLEVDLEMLKYQFSTNNPKCVCCTAISNVTGYVLPAKEVFEVAKQYKAITVFDTAQALGLIEIDLRNIKADFLAFAGHKALYGPLGIGGFIDVNKIPLKEFIVGGTGSDSLNLEMPVSSPNKYESASSNIVAIAGLKAALAETIELEGPLQEKELLEYLITELRNIDKVTLYLPPEDSRIGMISFNVTGYKSEDVGMILDQDFDIAVRTGYHCAPFIHKYLKDTEFLGTVRVGLGRFTTKEDLDVLISAIKELCE